MCKKYEVSKEVAQTLERNFVYHPPKEGQPEKYLKVRAQAKQMADFIVTHCPESHERDVALDKLQEVVMWVNASIARHE